MNMKWLRPLGSAFFLLMLCLHPGDALAASAEALLSWALSVAPALLPFLITAPALTCPEICALLSRISSPFLRLFRLPENSTGALLIGLMSGSPAGAAALASVSPAEADPPGAYLRAALMASGASPAFLMTTAAVVLLNAPEVGWLLFRSQLLAILASGLILRHAGTGRPAASAADIKQSGSVSSAVQTVIPPHPATSSARSHSLCIRFFCVDRYSSVQTHLVKKYSTDGQSRQPKPE